MNILSTLATIDPLQNLPTATESKGVEIFGHNAIVLAFAAVVVVLLVSAWAIFFRKPQRTVSITPEEAAGSVSGKGRRRKIKQRYPTLAETGGLPPVKSKS